MAVLGEREEGGPHIKGRLGAVWHAKCFVCDSKLVALEELIPGCSRPLANADHLLLPSGQPSCLSCTRLLDDDAPHVPSDTTSRLPRPNVTSSPAQVVIQSRALTTIMPRSTAVAIQAKRAVVSDLVAAVTARSAIGSSLAIDRTSMICPGCGVKVSPLERGTINGPKSARWHQMCLKCGRGIPGVGCGKPLDDGATLRHAIPLCRLCAVSPGQKHPGLTDITIAVEADF